MAPLSEERLTYLVTQCNPHEWLAPTDLRNVPIDTIEDGGGPPRGEGWADRIVQRLTRAAPPGGDVVCFFSGLPGSGKTTELRRVADLLGQRGWLPVVIDAALFIDLDAPIDLPDVLLPILTEAERGVRLAGGNLSDVRDSPWLAKLDDWFAQRGVRLRDAEPADGRSIMALRDRPLLRAQVRDVVTARPAEFHREVVDHLAGIQRRARELPGSPRGLALLYDSLEAVRGTPSAADKVLASAEALFVHDRPWLRLHVPALYTVPPQLTFPPQLPLEFMPMVKLRERGAPERRSEAGYAALRAVVERRVPFDDLRALFGDASEAVARALVDEMIAHSGGYPRVLIQILQEMLLVADPCVTEEVFRLRLRRLGARFRQAVLSHNETVPWLARVAHEHLLKTDADDERAAATRMIQYNVVLMYLNGDPWWDLLPWVREMPEIQGALTRLRAAPAGD